MKQVFGLPGGLPDGQAYTVGLCKGFPPLVPHQQAPAAPEPLTLLLEHVALLLEHVEAHMSSNVLRMWL